MDIAELKNADGEFAVGVGDCVQAMVVLTSGGATLSRRLARRPRAIGLLVQGRVEGKVQGDVKGGYEVRVGPRRAGSARFPSPRRKHVGARRDVYQFRIIEYDEEGANIVLSRRAAGAFAGSDRRT